MGQALTRKVNLDEGPRVVLQVDGQRERGEMISEVAQRRLAENRYAKKPHRPIDRQVLDRATGAVERDDGHAMRVRHFRRGQREQATAVAHACAPDMLRAMKVAEGHVRRFVRKHFMPHGVIATDQDPALGTLALEGRQLREDAPSR